MPTISKVLSVENAFIMTSIVLADGDHQVRSHLTDRVQRRWTLLQVVVHDLTDLLLLVGAELHRIAAFTHLKALQADRFFHGGR